QQTKLGAAQNQISYLPDPDRPDKPKGYNAYLFYLKQLPLVYYKYRIENAVSGPGEFLVLGTDWFIEHRAKLDIKSKEVTLPTADLDIIVSMVTSRAPLEIESIREMYVIIDGGTMGIQKENYYEDPRLKNLKEKNKALFTNGIEELTQTDIIEPRIELTEHSPIKQRPYRIPHYLY
ncbi:hypothetical protein BB560_001875, partial [Smittium megazygosporum]